MAYSQTDLDNLDKIITSGDLLIQYEDSKIRRRDLDDLVRIRKAIQADIDNTNGITKPKLNTFVMRPVSNL